MDGGHSPWFDGTKYYRGEERTVRGQRNGANRWDRVDIVAIRGDHRQKEESARLMTITIGTRQNHIHTI